ncbi:hypothetical protein GRS66_009772 [Saccharomyces pastorianus]|uniref:Uncharacterized protein n=1 Tax=Saccharomyces pastorianus TaxID=27292 RepID=A0A6C1ECY5_SACPS|nr:hypothetical protein GRS66_009772 [Saccharomyces pastorianus]
MDEDKLVDQLLSKEDSSRDDHCKPKNEDVSLYGLLDEVSNGRRLMNCLFHSSMQVGTRLSTNKLDQKCRQILRDWTDEEKTMAMDSGGLQLDAPVLFSWSHNAASTSVQGNTNTNLKGSTHGGKKRTKITTSSQLFDKASAEISRCISQTTNSWMVDESTNASETNGIDNDKPSSPWASSSFKVDPLQKFVVKQLPKPKKKPESDQAKKNKTKRKSFFGFWGHSSSKSSSKKKPEKPIEIEADVHEESGTPSPPLDEDASSNNVCTTQSNQESMNSQQVEPVESEVSVENTHSDHGEFEEFKQATVHANDLLSCEPSIANPLSLNLGSFVPLQPKKKTS